MTLEDINWAIWFGLLVGAFAIFIGGWLRSIDSIWTRFSSGGESGYTGWDE